jgi:hypothetical protein
MSLRFAIIKVVKTAIGDGYEDVVYEYHEDRVHDDLLENLARYLPAQKRYGRGYSSDEIARAFEVAWVKTVEDFKKVTVTIF